MPGFYPETPAAPASTSRYAPSGNSASSSNNPPNQLGSVSRAGGPIRRGPGSAITRARAHSTPYARPPPQNTPGSGNRSRRDDEEDENEVHSPALSMIWDADCKARIKKSLGEKTVELVGSLVSGVKDWFSSSKTPKREYVQSVVPRKTTPQRSLTSRMEEGFDDDEPQNTPQQLRDSGNMFSPSLAPHYAGHTPYLDPRDYTNIEKRWIVKQRTNPAPSSSLIPPPSLFPLPDTQPGHRRQDSQSKYATLPAKRSSSSAALIPLPPNKRPRQHGSLRAPKEWQLSKDRFAEQDAQTLDWCAAHDIDPVALASGHQKRPPLPSFADIQRYESLRNDVAFFERQGIRFFPPRYARKPSSLRHATSSYELSRIAQENSAYNASAEFLPTDTSANKMHTWRELLRLKDIRAKTERENAQLERSKQRNGYSSRTGSRSSSIVRGVAGEMSDDVWILPGLGPHGRPTSRGGSLRERSVNRMRTASPGGSWRSQDGATMRGRRPRGRDVFGTPEVQEEEYNEPMIDEATQTGNGATGLLLPPPSRGESMSDVDSTPRRKRPGYFSAREEDLDPLEMDLDDFVPARKKQRTSVSIPQGPKFAALWDPARRENWPLGESDEVIAKKVQEEMEQRDREERQRVKEVLKDLENPAFNLPPSARKEKTRTEMDGLLEQESPTKQGNEGDIKFAFSNVGKKNEEFKFELPKKTASPPKGVENGSNAFSFDFTNPPTSPKKAADDFKLSLPTSPPKSTTEPEPKDTPSKTSTFMQSILGNAPSKTSAEENMEDIPSNPKENGIKSPEIPSQSQSSPSKFQFSLPPSQSTIGGLSQESSNGEKPAMNGGFKFGSFGGSTSFSATKQTTSPAHEEPKPINPPVAVETPKFTFGMSKPVEDVKETTKPDATEKPVEAKSAPTFNFGSSQLKTDVPTMPVFNAQASPNKETTAPTFGTSVGLGGFGSAFKKSDSDKPKPLFGAPSISPSTNGTTAKPPPAPTESPAVAPRPVFGSGITGFTFGKTTPAPAEPPKEEPPPPPASAPSAPQDLDESMDITDSPPASRAPSFAGIQSDVPSQFPAFPTSAPTSAPATAPAEAPKLSFNFGTTGTSQVNGTEKPTLPSFQFSSGPAAPPAEKKTGFTFGAAAANTTFGSPAPSPAPAFGGFAAAFPPKKEEAPAEPTKPVEKPFTFGSTTTAPVFGSTVVNPPEQKAFGAQTTTTAPIFGGNASNVFGNTPAFPSNPPTSAPVSSPSSAGAFTFNFNAPAPNASSFGSGGSTFSFTPTTAPVSNPFSNPAPSVTSPPVTGFPGISSAPVSPQNQQLPTFPSVQSPFGQPQQQSQNLFGASTAPAADTNFQFAQNIPPSPIFTLGSSQMQRSSSDAGPSNNISPSGRRFAQPRRRLNRPR